MPTDNLSAVLHGINDVRMEQWPIPEANPNQLLIRVHTVGICGSDVHYVVAGHIGDFVVKEPMILGHEASGVVLEVGSRVKGFSVGDRVAMEPGVSCMHCQHCKKGRYNLCPDVQFFATPPVHGTLTRIISHDASFCYKLPDHVSMEEGALLEPLNVAVHACRRANLSIGQSVLICGAGPMGILNLITAKAMGTGQVLLTDIDDVRLASAKQCGADYTINVSGKSIAELVAEIKQVMGGQPEVSIECTGVPSSIETAIWNMLDIGPRYFRLFLLDTDGADATLATLVLTLRGKSVKFTERKENNISWLATQAGGVLLLIGLAADRADLPITAAATKELDIRGVLRFANCYPTALEMISRGIVDLKPLTTAHYRLEESTEAFKRARLGDVLKVFIHCYD